MSFLGTRTTPSTGQGVGYRELESSSTTPRTSHHSGSSSSTMYSRDWRTALRTPPTYRIGNRTLRFNYHFGMLLVGAGILIFLFCYVRTGSQSSSDVAWIKNSAAPSIISKTGDATQYNSTYPLTPPIVTAKGGMVSYRLGMIADLDDKSLLKKEDGSLVWRSYFKKGHLIYTAGSAKNAKADIKIRWDAGDPIVLESSYSLKGRGMELSELVTFNGKLLTFDDRTGIVYELSNDKVIPWVILMDGNGHNAKGFKTEWAAVQRQTLFVGSMGKEWTSGQGDFENENPMFVKTVSTAGAVTSLDWSYQYKLLRQESLKIQWPGYMLHESGVWSETNQKWYFLPRRCSTERYNETRDEYMGCNVLISADERFNKIDTVELDPANTAPTHGFSSFKFVPGTGDTVILAIKSEELNGKTQTFITAFDIGGKTILPETQIDTTYKYEGIEFI